MRDVRLPNLELLEYIAKSALKKDKEWVEKYKKATENKVSINGRGIDIVVYDVFMQTWGSTATGFDVTKSREAIYAGQMITEAYTVIFHERFTDVYIVFFDNKICYMVNNANERFFHDIAKRDMASLSMAGVLY